jgi:hypothetical protein
MSIGKPRKKEKSMSKSRRDLSLVAIAALVASSFAMAAPAQAAGELKIEPTSGSGFAVPHKDSIALTVSVTGGNDSDELVSLKYKLSNDGSFDVNAVSADTATATAGVTATIIDSSASEADDVLTDSAYAAGDNINVLTITAEDNASAVFDGTASTKRVTVLAFVDKNNNDAADEGEWQATQEVSFVDWDDVEVTNVLTQPVLGATTRTATLSGANINLAQSSLVVEFVDKGASAGVEDSSSVTRTYSSARNDLTFSIEGQSAVTSGTYSAGVYWGSTAVTSSVNRLAPLSSRSVDATTVNQITGTAVRSEFNTAIAANDSADKLKSGSGSLTYVVEVTTSATVAVANKTVSLKLTETNATSLDAATVTVGSVTLTNASNSVANTVTATATTGADGKATFVINYTGLDKTEAFKILASVDGVAEAEVTLTAEDSIPATIFSADVRSTDEELVVATGSTFSLTYHVLDQFGALYKGTDATVTVTDEYSINFTANVSNGAAVVAMPSYGTATDGRLSMSADVDTTGAGTPTVDAFAHEVLVGAVNAPSAVAIAGTFGTAAAPLNLNSESTARADVRFGEYTTAPNAEITDASVTVTDANGNGTRSQVTFSGTNLIFESDVPGSAEVYEKGSITVWTDINGVADVDISSQYAGKQVLTVTAGGATATKDIYFGATGADAGTSLAIDMPLTATPGSTFQVTGTLTDKFGNPVNAGATALSVSYSGPGIAFGTLPTTTDANGQFKFAVLLGANDSGTGTVTASYDQNGDSDFVDAKDLTASKSLTVGSGTFSGTYGTVSAWTVLQDDGTAKVYVKFPTVGERVRIGHQTGGSGSYETIYVKTTSSETMDGLRQVAGVGTYVVRTIDLDSGTNRIRVTVGDDTLVQVRYNQ